MPNRAARSRICVLLAAGVLAGVLHVVMGSSPPERVYRLGISLGDLWGILAGGPDSQHPLAQIVWQLRLPRVVACLLVGFSLGVVGSSFQALFRNPLAEPYIIGSASGAAVGGSIVLVMGWSMALGGLGMVAGATATGIAALLAVTAMARIRGRIDQQRLLIGGVVSAAMLSALVACILLASGRDTNEVLRWLLGSMTPMFWNRLIPLALAVAIGSMYLVAQGRRLNAFAMGEEMAKRLGVRTERLKPAVLAVGTAMTSIAVGTVGIIGFLGMVSPHIARRYVGIDWRYSLVASGLVGATLLAASDILAQWLVPGAELPVGIVTALLGAPALLILLRSEAPS